MRTNIVLLPPVLVVRSALGRPMEGCWLDLGKGPAHQATSWVRTLLHDILASRAAYLLREEIGRRVVPQNAPSVEIGVVDPQRRSVPVSCSGELLDARLSLLEARDHPDVLYGASLQYPARVNLAATGVRGSVLKDCSDLHLPSSDEPRIETELRLALRVRAVAWST